MNNKKDVTVYPKPLELKLSAIPPALRLKSKSIEKVRGSSKVAKETIEYHDGRRSSVITKIRTEEETKVYHEGKILINGKEIPHDKHPKPVKIHKKDT